MAETRRRGRWRLTHLLAVGAPAIGGAGIAGDLELLPHLQGTPALACGVLALFIGAWVVVDMQIRRRHIAWSLLGIVAIALGAAVLLLRVQG